ncbi:hypothetical protein UUU_23280 [Klebsiella pneumoniae subsp. pneumoniae DSM 30104 = JCM 1662 = NBRC 14940]|nr:hypothetical protein UUU_23280 [Klebsiella pneumoniae subsp. pneumoniae DSM 30104 = JCM 1662 = NBRC 14940]
MQSGLLAGIQLVEAFHQIVNRFHLFEERLQFIQRQRGRAVAFRVVRIRMRFNKQTGDTYRHTGAGQLAHLRTTTAGGCAKRVAALQRVGDVENDRRVVGGFLHHAEAEHIHDQVVVTEVSAAVAEDYFVVTPFDKLIDDVAHLTRADELRLLDVDHRPGLRHRFHQVSLAREESRKLDHVHHVSYRLRLAGFMNVGDDFHAKGLLQLLENLHPFFQTRPTIGVDGGTVGFIKGGFEDVGNTKLLRNGDIMFADTHRQVARLQHVHPAEQHERQVVRYVDITNANHFLFHKFALSGCNRNGSRLMQCNLFMRNRVDLRADHLADRILRALLNEIAQIQQRHVIAVQLGVYQPAVADLIRIFRIKLQQRFAGAQGQLHLPLFHQRRLQGVQQLADHLGVIRFVEIFIKQFRHRPNVALEPYLQGMLVEGLAVKRINQPHLFAGFRVRTQQHLGREDHRHHRQRQALGDPQQDRA